jgi:cell division ATPase FtsA
VTLGAERGFMERTVNLDHLRRIMSLRLEEIFELIACEINQAGLAPYLARRRPPLRRVRADPAD